MFRQPEDCGSRLSTRSHLGALPRLLAAPRQGGRAAQRDETLGHTRDKHRDPYQGQRSRLRLSRR